MFHSSTSPYNDPAFYCSAGPPPLTGTFNPYTFFDATATATARTTLSSSPPFSSASSPLPYNNHFMHRSSSTHSFTHHHNHPDRTTPNNPFFSSRDFDYKELKRHVPRDACCDLLDFHSSEPVRRVFSAGDLQGMNCLQGSAENCTQDGAAAAAAGRVGRYSAEERMKRIERYRSKRNQRNFHKKITYACRKTLADSRPRVRGRFARNGEIEAETEPEPEASEVSYESHHNHNNHENHASYNNYDNGGNAGEWWRQMQAALTTTDEEEECYYDEDIWANIFSMDLLS